MKRLLLKFNHTVFLSYRLRFKSRIIIIIKTNILAKNRMMAMPVKPNGVIATLRHNLRRQNQNLFNVCRRCRLLLLKQRWFQCLFAFTSQSKYFLFVLISNLVFYFQRGNVFSHRKIPQKPHWQNVFPAFIEASEC